MKILTLRHQVTIETASFSTMNLNQKKKEIKDNQL